MAAKSFVAFAVLAALAVALLASHANAYCVLSGGSATIPALSFGQVFACVSLQSQCVTPGGDLICNPANCTGTCCSGGGIGDQIAYAADNNVVCTINIIEPPQPVNSSFLAGSININTENEVYVQFFPVPAFANGTVQVTCTSVTAGNDCSQGPPPVFISQATYTFYVTPLPCQQPCYGTCGDLGCTCPNGNQPPACVAASSGVMTSASLALVVLAFVATLFVNL